MCFQDFEQIGQFTIRCTTCGTEMPTGIITASEHWTKCTGKEFYEAVMAKTELGEQLTEIAIEELKKHFLQPTPIKII